MPRARWALIVHILGVVGLCVIGFVVMRVNLHSLIALIASVGAAAFLFLCIWSLVLSCALGAAWAILLPRSFGRTIGPAVWARLVRDSAGEVLPFSQLGGFIGGVRAAVLCGIPGRISIASSVADVAVETAAQFAFVFLGLLLAALTGRIAPGVGVAIPVVMVCLAITLFLAPAGLAALVPANFIARGLAGKLQRLRESLKAIYASPVRITTAFMVHSLAWIGSAVTVVVAARILRVHIGLSDAVVIEAAVSSMRSVAFLVPGALGVQEGGYMLMLAAIGAAPDVGLAISLLKRTRELCTGIPALLIWWALESKEVLKSRVPQA